MIFARIGHVTPGHARSAVRRLVSVGRALRNVRDAIYSENTSLDVDPRSLLAQVDASIEVLEDNLKDAISDWGDVHPEAVEYLLHYANEERES